MTSSNDKFMMYKGLYNFQLYSLHEQSILIYLVYQYTRQTHKRRTPQTSDSTNVGRTNVGPVQTSDQ